MGVNDRLATALADRYRIERELGAGGMATVYLAEDLKHDRKVAIKVLKPELAAVLGAERFVVEIKTTAAMSHPHILPLFDSGTADGFLFYVMPYIQGETIRERLNRETQFGVDEAVRIAREVADALDYAHRHGVIHRDIKPENILLHDGRAMVMDFGIALAVSAAAGGRMTETGLSLGTPHYMSPEQATAEKEITARSDQYSLASVLYEMLAGQPPHVGGAAQQVIMRIITEPARPVNEFRRNVPPNVVAAVARSLEKLPADRFDSAAKFADALGNPAYAPSVVSASAAAALFPSQGRRAILVAYAVAALGMLVGVAGWLRSGPHNDTADAARFVIPLRDSLPLALGGSDARLWGRPSANAVAISPDGQMIVVAAMRVEANGPTVSRLYRRRIDDERLQAIPGTDSATGPFFSASGREIGFFVGRSLRSVSLTGDSARRIANEISQAPTSGTWGADGTIVFATYRGLWVVPAAGGVPQPLVADSSWGGSFNYAAAPQLLTGGTRVLFHTHRTRDPRPASLRLIDRSSGTVTKVLDNAMHGTVVGDTLLLFLRDGLLLAVRFDASAGKVMGDPVIVEENVAQAVAMPNSSLDSGRGEYAVSARGDLVFALGGAYPARLRYLVIRAPDGRTSRLALPNAEYSSVRAAPASDRLLLNVRTPARGTAIALFDMTRDVLTMLNTGGYYDIRPTWSTDERRFVYQASSESDTLASNLFLGSVDGSAPPQRLTTDRREQRPVGWLPDGTIVFVQAGTANTIWLRSPDGTTRRWLESGTSEAFPALSPDGRHIAYVTGSQVYVRAIPGPGSAVAVTGLGGEPVWSPRGDQVYFLSRRDLMQRSPTLMVADVQRDEPIRVGRARPVMESFPAFPGSTPIRGAWDIMRDGSLVMIVPADTSVLADFNRAAIHEIHVSQRALRALRLGVTASTPNQ